MNIINNNCISKIKTENSVFASIENLNSFINGNWNYKNKKNIINKEKLKNIKNIFIF